MNAKRRSIPNPFKRADQLAKATEAPATVMAATGVPVDPPSVRVAWNKGKKTGPRKRRAQPDHRTANAAKARAALAKKRAAGELKPRKPRKPPPGNESSFLGRIDLALGRIGKTRPALERHLGVSGGYLAHFAREGETHYRFKPERMAKAAEFLGVTVEWLDKGDGKPSHAIAKAAAPIARANGTPHAPQGMIDQALHRDADTTMLHLWGLLAPDVKMHLIARGMELLAQHIRRG